MNFFRRQPWYSEGLAFECIRCGRCCAGPNEGYVWVRPQEIVAMAELLQLSSQQFAGTYLRNVSGRHSLTEDPKTRDCIFLGKDAAGLATCRVYSIRPTQCRTWPFWPSNLSNAESWCQAGQRCPGVNRGSRHGLEVIQQKRDLVNP